MVPAGVQRATQNTRNAPAHPVSTSTLDSNRAMGVSDDAADHVHAVHASASACEPSLYVDNTNKIEGEKDSTPTSAMCVTFGATENAALFTEYDFAAPARLEALSQNRGLSHAMPPRDPPTRTQYANNDSKRGAASLHGPIEPSADVAPAKKTPWFGITDLHSPPLAFKSRLYWFRPLTNEPPFHCTNTIPNLVQSCPRRKKDEIGVDFL